MPHRWQSDRRGGQDLHLSSCIYSGRNHSYPCKPIYALCIRANGLKRFVRCRVGAPCVRVVSIAADGSETIGGDNVLRLLKSSVATGKMHAGRKQKSGVSGYAMRRWPGRNDVKSGMGKIEPSKVPHPLLRTAFPLYGAAHVKGKCLYKIAAPRRRQTSSHERCYPLRPQGPKSGVSWKA